MNDPKNKEQQQNIFKAALKTVFIYLIVSFLWIFFSDSLLSLISSNPFVIKEISIAKGWFFVIVTSLLLYLLIRRNLIRLQKSKEALYLIEKRWEDAFINTNDGLWEWDIITNKTFFSTQWKEMLGYSNSEIANNYSEWERRLHPKDLPVAKEALSKHFEGKTSHFTAEFRMRTKGGSYKWILARGKVTEYSAEGKPLRILGTHTDITERKKLEEEIRQGEERYRIVSENSGNIVWVFEVVSNSFKFISPSMQEFLGNVFEDPVIRERKEVLMETSIKTIMEQFTQRLQNYESGNLSEKNRTEEIEKKCKDGSSVHIIINTTFIHGEDGLVKEVLGVTRDVTDQKEAVKKIAESEEKYRSVFENSNIAILISTPDGRIISANHEAEKLFDLSESEICKTGHSGIVDISDSALNKYLEDREKFENVNAELTLIKKGGISFKASVSSVSFTDRSGDKFNSIIVRDLTDQRHAEEILRKSEELYRSIFEFSPVAAVFWDKETKIIFWNKAAENTFGWSKEEVIGQKFTSFFIPESSREYVETNVSFLVNNIKQGITVNKNLKKDGSEILCEWNNTIIPDKFGQPETIISLAKDITDQKRLEEEIFNSQEQLRKLNEDLELRVNERTKLLEAANSELEAFSYSVSHDLRAPLRAIDGFSRMIVDEYSSGIDENGKRLLAVIRTNVKKMGTLIDDLLAFSRLGRKDVKLSDVDMNSVFETIFVEQAALYKGLNIEFILNKLPKAQADSNLIKHIIANLVSNAIKFSSKKENPKIEINGWTENNFNIYSIKDNGAGFNMKYSAKLFGVFQRLHTEEEFEGTGAGLAIVQRIVHKHNGRIWAESIPDLGSKFYFSLPVVNL